MLTIKEYNDLQKEVMTTLLNKRFQGRYKEIVFDIKELNNASDLCSKQKISYSNVIHHVRFLKGIYNEELKEIMQYYQEIIFPDFSYKNDLNAMINGPYALKIWLMRYLSLKVIKKELYDLINIELTNLSITQQYQEIDTILFKALIKEKVTNN